MSWLLDVIEFMEQHLTPREACKLACVSKSMQKVLSPIEEEIFKKHENIALLDRCVCNDDGSYRCTHVTPGGRRTKYMTIPMPFGTSSKGKLRGLSRYKCYWENMAISCQIELKPEFHLVIGPYADMDTTVTITEDCLFTTKSYTEEVKKVLVFLSIRLFIL